MDNAKRNRVVASVMIATFLTAIDATIVETAMPRIVGQLGGFSLLTWLVSAYLLTSTATVPVYGKLADIIGRKRTFTIGAIIFVGGSLLCGNADTMIQLVLYRGLQGLGAGAIMPVVQTIIGDIFTPTERAKVQGYFASVWGLSGLMGPLVGGFIVDNFSWQWLFYINLPPGALALYMLLTNLDEKIERRSVPVDYAGSVLLTAGVSALLLALLEGGVHYPWTSPFILGLLGAAAVLLSLFFWQERRHPDPLLPLDLFKDRTIGFANLASLVIGGVFYGTTVYLPLWAQGVQGFSATRSGFSLFWLSIGWPLAATFGGRLILKVGQRPAALLGLGLNLVGALGLLLLGRTGHDIPEIGFAAVTFLIGGGMGFATLSFILGVQASVTWERRGVATASLQFIRTLGGLIWVSVMGGVMNMIFASKMQGVPGASFASAGEAADFANDLLDPAVRATIAPDLLKHATTALADGLRGVHWIVLGCAVVTLVITLWLPNLRYDSKPEPKQAMSGH